MLLGTGAAGMSESIRTVFPTFQVWITSMSDRLKHFTKKQITSHLKERKYVRYVL